MKTIIISTLIVLCAVFLYWLFILRPGRLDFWRIAAKYPDDAYEHFLNHEDWKVFKSELPDNYRELVPKSDWTGPFRLWIPKLNNQVIYVFGRYPDFEKSQNKFVKSLKMNA